MQPRRVRVAERMLWPEVGFWPEVGCPVRGANWFRGIAGRPALNPEQREGVAPFLPRSCPFPPAPRAGRWSLAAIHTSLFPAAELGMFQPHVSNGSS